MQPTATYTLRNAEHRGAADHGWLRSQHSFSFGGYRDPAWMGFGALRVINDDRVEPGAGFDTHPHRDMEILSFVLDGALAHRDTLGNGATIRPGEIQLMSAGSGISHSEFNASDVHPVHFLQIWIEPAQRGQPPRYAQAAYPVDHTGLQLLAAPEAEAAAAGLPVPLRQQAWVWRLALPAGGALPLPRQGHRQWLHGLRGRWQLAGVSRGPGDAIGVQGAPADPVVRALDGGAEALLFALP